MTALKEAAHNLLTTLKNAEKTPGDIKVVDRSIRGRRQCRHRQRECHLDRLDRLGGRERHLQQVLVHHEEQLHVAQRRSGRPADHSTWNGCVNDRDQNNDVLNTATARRQRRHHVSRRTRPRNCPAAMMPLSDDWTALNTKIDAMTPTGNTNVTIGLQMAWQTLSPVDAVQRAGAGARSRQGHHPADRRREHPEPLDRPAVLDRRPHAEGLRQRQGRQHQALHGARDRRQRDAAQELRHQAGHVLRRAAGEPAQSVLLDRAELGEPAIANMMIAAGIGAIPPCRRWYQGRVAFEQVACSPRMQSYDRSKLGFRIELYGVFTLVLIYEFRPTATSSFAWRRTWRPTPCSMTARAPAALALGPARQRPPHLRAGAYPDHGSGRRRRRLQPRQQHSQPASGRRRCRERRLGGEIVPRHGRGRRHDDRRPDPDGG